MTAAEILGAVVMTIGALFSTTAALGVALFPTSLSRMHAATKSAALGLALISIGVGVAVEGWALFGIGALVSGFLFMTAPISGHMLGRAAYAAGQAPGLVHDDLAGVEAEPLGQVERTRAGFSFGWWFAMLAIWTLLWREVSPAVLAGGAVVAAVVEAMRSTSPGFVGFRPVGFSIFFVRYVGMVVTSSLKVAWEVVTPGTTIREAIVAIPLTTDSIPVALLLSNAITYTPGTLTVELTEEPRVVYVHVLQFTTVEAIAGYLMEKLPNGGA